MADTYLPDIEESLKKVLAMDWEKLIAGHPGPAAGRPAPRRSPQAARLSAGPLRRGEEGGDEGKSYADAQKDIKLPKYESWPATARSCR